MGAKIERKPVDRKFLFLFLGILLFGFVMLASASAPIGDARFDDAYYFFKHQVLSGLIPGTVLLFICLAVPYELYRRFAFALLGLSVFLLFLVLIPGIGTDHGTFAKSWISIGGFSFQPAEIVKLTFLMYIAAWMEKRKSHLQDFNSGLVPFVVILVLIGGLMVMQPDLGTLSIIVAMAFLVYFVAGGPLTFIFGLGAIAVVGFGILVKTSSYRFERFVTFLRPELDPAGFGYQVNQALLAVGSGGFFGRGYGDSIQKFQYLPEVVGDSVFAVIAEELGFLFTVPFLALFFGWIIRGIKIGEAAKDDFGKFLVIGIMGWFGFQAILNIGAMIAILPITGVPLPFVSHGGTALAVSMAAVGIVLNISREAKLS